MEMQTLKVQLVDAAPHDLQLKERLRWLFFAYMAFVVCGSLVPFQFVPSSWDGGLDRFLHLPWGTIFVGSPTDWVVNFGLQMPVVILAGQLVEPRSSGGATWAFRLALLAFCALLAVTVEFAQQFFPPRVASASDVAMQVIGAFVALAAHVAYGSRLRAWLSRVKALNERQEKVRTLLGVYLALLLVFSVLPLDLSISPADLYRKWRDGRVILVPFAFAWESVPDLIYKTLTDVLLWMPVGALWALDRSKDPLWRMAIRGALAAGIIEFAQLFVQSRVSNVTDILTATTGVIAGASLLGGWAAFAALDVAAVRRGLWLATGVWLGMVLVLFWYPFDFDAGRLSGSSTWDAMTHAPLSTYFFRSEFGALNEMLRKVLTFLPGGALMGLLTAFSTEPAGPRARWPLVALLLVAVGVEFGQLLLPGKVADLTDVLFEWSGGVLGLRLSAWMRRLPVAANDVPPQSDSLPPPVSLPRLSAWSPVVAGALGFAASGAAILLVCRLPGVPYNLTKLVPEGAGGWAAAFGLSASLWWLATAPFALLGRRRVWLLAYPLALLLHAVVTWALLRATVPLTMIHKIIGSPVLGWPWQWEDLGRFVALHLSISTQLLGAMLLTRLILRPGTLGDVLYWFAGAMLMAWPLHFVVMQSAGTDNLVELVRDRGGFGPSTALACAVFSTCLAGTAWSAALAQHRRRLLLGGLGVGASLCAAGLFQAGLEPILVKYDKSFSALQFLLSAERSSYAAGVSLASRYLIAFSAIVATLIALQWAGWRGLGMNGPNPSNRPPSP
jgi:VanZ family protein